MEASNLSVSIHLKNHLRKTTKWGKFMSIVGFVMVGFILMGAFSMLYMGTEVASPAPISWSNLAIIYFIMAVVYLFPVVFLFRYSRQMKLALDREEQHDFEEAFENLGKLFAFFGILTAVILLFYGLALIAIAAGGALGSFM